MKSSHPTCAATLAALIGFAIVPAAHAQVEPGTSGPAVSGPAVSGPAVSGPAVPGPAVPGPSGDSAPARVGPADPGELDTRLPGLGHPALAALRGDLLALLRDDPAAFADLEAARARARRADRRKRGRLAPVGRELKALGPQALLPMLHALIADDPLARPMTLTAWIAWRAGLLEAVGALRDPRALPVLLAILDGPDHDPTIIRAAVAAIGKLGHPDAIAALIARTERTERASATQRAYLEGLGTARRLAMAEHLRALALQLTEPDHRVALARAAGDLGNAWAWETPALQATGEGEAVRDIAARLLIDLHRAHNDPTLRAEITKSLLLIDHPQAPKWAEEEGGDPALAMRLRNNPLHPR